jgi:hypothetical protein
MFAYQSLASLIYQPQTFVYSRGVVGYVFQLTQDVVGLSVLFLFMPKYLGVAEVADVPLYRIEFVIPESLNSVQLKYQPEEVCEQKEKVNKYLDVVEYASYGVLALSVLPAKIVGLELFGVLQLAFLGLGSIDHLNPLEASLTKLSASNGYNFKIDQDEPHNSRLLQTTSRTSNRIQTIGYASNFLRNCNLMLFLVFAVMTVSFFLYLLTLFCKKFTCISSIVRRLAKEVLLTLLLFNCFNFAYSAGLHFAYADKSDSLYVGGTLAAAASLLAMFGMTMVLSCTEDTGFG